MGIKHFYDVSCFKDYSILFEKGKETRSRKFSYIVSSHTQNPKQKNVESQNRNTQTQKKTKLETQNLTRKKQN